MISTRPATFFCFTFALSFCLPPSHQTALPTSINQLNHLKNEGGDSGAQDVTSQAYPAAQETLEEQERRRDFTSTSYPDETSGTSVGDKSATGVERTTQTVIVGASVVVLLLAMAVLSKLRSLLGRCCRTPDDDRYVQDDIEKSRPEPNDDVTVHYDLWEKRGPEVKTVSATIASLTSQQQLTRHQRPRDKRTVMSYRMSFRNFVRESATDDVLPCYSDVTKGSPPGNNDPPPDYAGLGSSGEPNPAYSENEEVQ